MNPSTLIGIVASIGLLAVVLLFAAKEPALFIDLPSLGIVLVGTLAATFISYPLREVTRVFGLLWTVLRNERLYTRQDLDELVQISRLWISGDLPAVEKAVEQVSNPFLRTGVQLVIDNTRRRTFWRCCNGGSPGYAHGRTPRRSCSARWPATRQRSA